MDGQLRAKLAALEATYSTEGKRRARDVVVRLAADVGAETILDLWGGGSSARAFRGACPEAIVTSAEIDQKLWPALRLDAQTNGYAYHLGDVRTVEGRYDLVWLDLCSQASGSTRELLGEAAQLATNYLAVTIMPARENDELVSSDRLAMLPLWIERATQMSICGLLPYRRNGGLPMWLVLLDRAEGSSFHDRQRLDYIAECIDEQGWWCDFMLDKWFERRHDYATRRAFDTRRKAREARARRRAAA